MKDHSKKGWFFVDLNFRRRILFIRDSWQFGKLSQEEVGMRSCSLILSVVVATGNLFGQSKDPVIYYLDQDFAAIQTQLHVVKQKRIEADSGLLRIEMVKRQILHIKEVYELRQAGKKQLADQKLGVVKAIIETPFDPQYVYEIAPLFIRNLEGKPFPPDPTDFQAKLLKLYLKGGHDAMLDYLVNSLEEQKLVLQKEHIDFLRDQLNQIRTKK